MTPREKTAWVALVTTLTIWGPYFVHFLWRVAKRDLDGGAILTQFLICLGLTFVIMFGAVLIWVRRDRQVFDAPLDERETGIDARANRLGVGLNEALFAALALGTFWIAGFSASEFPPDPTGAMAVMVAHAILFAGMMSGLVRELTLVVQFRAMDWGD